MSRWTHRGRARRPAGTETGRSFSHRLPFFSLVAIVALLAALHAYFLPMPLFPVDDAFITLHNAAALSTGEESNFSGVTPLHGATSGVHLVLVAALSLVLDPAWALWAAAWVGAVLYLGAVLRAARLSGLGTGLTVASTVLAALAGQTVYQLLNGLETGLALAGVAWSLTLRLEEERRQRFLLPILAGQLPFLRPELAALSLLLLAERALARESWRRGVEQFTREVLLAAVSAAPWLVSYLIATGSPVPPTIAAKGNFFAEACWPLSIRVQSVGESLSNFSMLLGVSSVGVLFLLAGGPGRLAVLFVPILIGAYFMRFPGALNHYDYRYLYLLPPLTLFGFIRGLSPGSKLRRVAQFALVLACLYGIPTAIGAWSLYLEKLAFVRRELRGVSEFVREHVPADETLLIHDIGYLSTSLPHPMADFVGLKTPFAADLHRRATSPTCGRMRGVVVHEVALESKPDYLVMFIDWDRIYRITDRLRGLGWTLEPLRDPRVSYQVYQLTAPLEPPRLVIPD